MRPGGFRERSTRITDVGRMARLLTYRYGRSACGVSLRDVGGSGVVSELELA